MARKPRTQASDLTVTGNCPGARAVAKGTGLSEGDVRKIAQAKPEGCPLVKGGVGYRFTSVKDFQEWWNGLSEEARRQFSPRYARKANMELAKEIASRTWVQVRWNAVVTRLSKLPLERLEKLVEYWRSLDAETNQQAQG